MAYRDDSDLEFLSKMTSEELGDLVSCLTKDKDGSGRYTENLTTNEIYKEHYPNHHEYWKLIAEEIQRFGANSLTTILRRGNGVKYKEVIMDVCNQVKVKYDKDASVEEIENVFLEKVINDSLEKMSLDELKKLAEDLYQKDSNWINNPTKNLTVPAFLAIFNAGGFKSYQLTVIFANAILKTLIGRGLSFAGNILLVRITAIVTGPIGWGVAGLWTAIDIAGPAYRVTVPAALLIATLRKKHLYGKRPSKYLSVDSAS